MRTTWHSILFALALSGAAAGAATDQLKIATVDLRQLFDGYWKTKKADAEIKDQATDLDKEKKALVDNLQKATDDYKKILDSANDPAVSSEEREKRKISAEKKLVEAREVEQTIVQFDRQANSTLGERRRRMRDNLVAEIRVAITAKAVAGGYSMILDVSGETANSAPLILYSKAEDLTDGLLVQLNQGAPANFLSKPDETKPDLKKIDDKKEEKKEGGKKDDKK